MSGAHAKWTPEARARQSARSSETLRGRSVSKKTRTKIAVAQSGEKARWWAGDAVGYAGAHKRHRATLPKSCAHCGRRTGRLDVALRKDTPPERLLGSVRLRRHYSIHSDDYMRLCRSCHCKYDGIAPPPEIRGAH
jgi:hypothetical protein